MNTIDRYLNHLPNCNIMQDWTEAEQAMADTPEKFRDQSWYKTYNEMREKHAGEYPRIKREKSGLFLPAFGDLSWGCFNRTFAIG